MTSSARPEKPHNKLMIAVRYVLPTVIVLGGVIALLVNPSWDSAEGAAAVVGAGLSVALLNLLYRVGVRGDQERDAEDAARAYFDEHGRWPDEDQV